jgi:hypothetical protein
MNTIAVVVLSGCIATSFVGAASTANSAAARSAVVPDYAEMGLSGSAQADYLATSLSITRQMQAAAADMRSLLQQPDPDSAPWQAAVAANTEALQALSEEVATMSVPMAMEPTHASLHRAVYLCGQAADSFSSGLNADADMRARALAFTEQCSATLNTFAVQVRE